ncbi:MAG: Pyruvate dehydrogenase E1 component [uncultured Thermoleophilia bacterium]|uniref:Pyruvate dehydrogenase E1 component n=1 Tax=uncultured Thermoleophilia bacterium TaxID=1497501 RepID=A0A6J4TW16_9ACTN|nr:MAG: Pyruvate dehydrogenase E1 component [uncultured Thermoleophilia bacterium]
MAERPARTVALVEHHPRYWPDAQGAAEELRRVLGDVEVFLLVDPDGTWEAACAVVPADFRPARWVQARRLPAGDYASSSVDGLPAERLLERADGRPPFLIAASEAPTGEGEYEPGGETFGLSTRLGEQAGLHRIGVNVDVIRPGERSTKYHWHHQEEECFLVLSGSGLLQVGERTYRVGPGDFFAKTEGPERAHQFVNDGDHDLRIVTIGEHRGDVVEYPPPPWRPGAPYPVP